jgi:hypothetical protein
MGRIIKVAMCERNASLPVVRELKLKSGVVGCFYNDDIGAEVRSKKQTQRSDLVRFLGFTAR